MLSRLRAGTAYLVATVVLCGLLITWGVNLVTVVGLVLLGGAVVLFFQPAFEYQKQEATLLQSNLKEIGVTLELTPIAFPDWLARLSDKSQIPQMFLLGDFAH